MNTAVVIPARLASTRLPRKVLRDICGKPLIQWAYEGAAGYGVPTFVATPDQEVLDTVYGFGGRTIMTPLTSTVLDRCSIAAGYLSEKGFQRIIVVQGDEPMVVPGMLELAVSEWNMITQLVKPLSADEDPWNPNIPKVVLTKEGYIMYASRCPIPGATPEKDHTFNATFYKQVCVMAFDTRVLMSFRQMKRGPVESAEGIDILRYIENGGYTIKALVSPFDTKAVDTAEDLAEVRSMIGRRGCH